MKDRPTPVMNPHLTLEAQLCFPVYALSRLITKAYQPLLEGLGLTYPQYLVLLLLWEHHALTVKELGKKMLLDSGTLTPLLKRMEQREWLSRRRDPRDERSVIIELQPAGRALQTRAQEVPTQMAALLRLSPAEIDTLRLQLRDLIKVLA